MFTNESFLFLLRLHHISLLKQVFQCETGRDLSGTIHSARGYKVCRAAALQPVSKRSLQYMPLNFK